MNPQPTSWLSANIKPILALVIVSGGLSYFFMITVGGYKSDPAVTIAIVALMSGATGYYFGSSSGSSKKDDALVGSVGNPTVTGDQPTINVTSPNTLNPPPTE